MNAALSGGTVMGSRVMIVETATSTSRPSATTRRRRSRSVTMPTRRPPSVMSTADTLWAVITRATSRMEVVGGAVTGSRPSRSLTVIPKMAWRESVTLVADTAARSRALDCTAK